MNARAGGARKAGGAHGALAVLHLAFDDADLMKSLCGVRDCHLQTIESRTGVTIAPRGNRLTLYGEKPMLHAVGRTLCALYENLSLGDTLGAAQLDAALSVAKTARAAGSTGDASPPSPSSGKTALTTGGGREASVIAPSSTLPSAFSSALCAEPAAAIVTPRRVVRTRGERQAAYLRLLESKALTFALGPAGTGKTYLAVAYAVSLLATGGVERIILSRPAVEAGERLGFLPGDVRDKLDPYLRPLYDALGDVMPWERVRRRMDDGVIEVAPLAFMRGRTLANAFVILDEAQNATPMQMKMFLTRLGEGARMAVTGDLSQADLACGATSGLRQAVRLLEGMENVAVLRFTRADVARHSLVRAIAKAYDALAKP